MGTWNAGVFSGSRYPFYPAVPFFSASETAFLAEKHTGFSEETGGIRKKRGTLYFAVSVFLYGTGGHFGNGKHYGSGNSADVWRAGSDFLALGFGFFWYDDQLCGKFSWNKIPLQRRKGTLEGRRHGLYGTWITVPAAGCGFCCLLSGGVFWHGEHGTGKFYGSGALGGFSHSSLCIRMYLYGVGCRGPYRRSEENCGFYGKAGSAYGSGLSGRSAGGAFCLPGADSRGVSAYSYRGVPGAGGGRRDCRIWHGAGCPHGNCQGNFLQ